MPATGHFAVLSTALTTVPNVREVSISLDWLDAAEHAPIIGNTV